MSSAMFIGPPSDRHSDCTTANRKLVRLDAQRVVGAPPTASVGDLADAPLRAATDAAATHRHTCDVTPLQPQCVDD